MNSRILQEKSETVMRCLQRVRDKKPATRDILLSDIDAQDIIVLNLERAVQACVDMASHVLAYTPLPAAQTMGDAFILLERADVISKTLAERMRKAVGLRNLLVHQYTAINWDIVWTVLDKHLQDPVDFVKAIQTWNA